MEIKNLMRIRFLRAKFFKEFHPLFISWMITDVCNMKCPDCDRNDGAIGHTGAECATKVGESAKRYSFWKVSLTGGEPLLHPGIYDIVLSLKSTGTRITMNTNGLLVPENIELIKELNGICISLDGRKELHDSIRGKGSFDAVCAALEVLKSNGVPVKLTCVINKKTDVNDINAVLIISKIFHAPVMFQPSRGETLGSCAPGVMAPDTHHYRSVISAIIKIKRLNYYSVLNSFSGLNHLYHWPDNKAMKCGAGLFFFRIDPAGGLFSCSNCMAGVSPKGNILNSDLEKIFPKAAVSGCAQCWCGDRIEANLIYSLNPDAIRNYVKTRSGYNL